MLSCKLMISELLCMTFGTASLIISDITSYDASNMDPFIRLHPFIVIYIFRVDSSQAGRPPLLQNLPAPYGALSYGRHTESHRAVCKGQLCYPWEPSSNFGRLLTMHSSAFTMCVSAFVQSVVTVYIMYGLT